MTHSLAGDGHRISSMASTVASAGTESRLLHSRRVAGRPCGQARALSPQPAVANLVIPVKIEASQLAWVLEHGADHAAGYVIAISDAESGTAPQAVLPEPARTRTGIDSEPKPFHAEPLG